MSGLIRYLTTRVIVTIPMLVILLSIVFLVLRVMPGDPAQAILGGRNVPEATVVALRARLGLDQPLHVQYGHYLFQIGTGNLGLSSRTGNKVLEDVLTKFPATLELALFAMSVAIPLGLLSGVYASTRADRPGDHVTRLSQYRCFRRIHPLARHDVPDHL